MKVCTGDCETVTRVRPRPGRDAVLRMPGTCVFDPCTCTTPLLPRPGGQQQVQCPGRRSARRCGCRDEECRTVRECQMVCKPVLHHGPGTGLPHGAVHGDASRCPYTTCRMVPEQHVRYETRTPLLHGAARRRSARSRTRPAGWCPSSTSATRRGTAATRSPEQHVRHVPYTTCRMVPEQHVRIRRRSGAATTCRRRSPCRCRTRPAGWSRGARPLRDAAALLHGAEQHVRPGAVHDLPDGDRAPRPLRSRCGAATTCRSSTSARCRTRPAGWCPSSTCGWCRASGSVT